MRSWLPFVVLTVLSWGTYIPTLHRGQLALGALDVRSPTQYVGGNAFEHQTGARDMVEIRDLQPARQFAHRHRKSVASSFQTRFEAGNHRVRVLEVVARLLHRQFIAQPRLPP